MTVELVEQKWTKLTKREELWVGWAQEAMHIMNGDVEVILAPGDAILDYADEREFARGRDADSRITAQSWIWDGFGSPLLAADTKLRWRIYERSLPVIEYANHIVDGKLHADLYILKIDGELWMESDRPKVVRKETIEAYLRQGYTADQEKS